MPVSTRNGLRIHYDIAGEGPPLVLVHANPFDRRLWMHQVARFSPFFRVIALDIRGYGLSDKPETPFTLSDMVRDVLGVCADEGIERAIFAGVSVGSGIALLLALDHPEIAQALVLVGGSSNSNRSISRRIEGFTAKGPQAYRLEHMRELFAPGFPETPAGQRILQMYSEDAHRLSGASIAQIFRARGACDMRGRLSELKMPVLVVNGAHDNSLEAGKFTAEHIGGAEHVTLPGAGHACNIEVPDAFDAAMMSFMQRKALWPDA